MAPKSRRSGAPVAEDLVDEAYQFDFYQAVRILEQLHPDWASVGEGLSPSAEPVRFRSHTELGFPPSDVVSIEVPEEDGPFEMDVSFMSLAGPHGPLPAPYTELIQDRVRSGDTTLRDFLDVLIHRLVALRYRGRKRHHVGLESGPPTTSTVARYLRAVSGLGPESAQGRLSVPDHALLRYAPLLNQSPSSAHGLSVILEDHFDAEIQVNPLSGQWIDLDSHQQTRIGRVGQNQALGESTVLGQRAWDQQARLTVEVQVSALDDYIGFFPEGEAHRSLVDLSKLYLDRNVELDLALTLDAEATSTAPLSTLLGPRLGQDAWVGTPQTDTVTTQVSPQTFTPEQEVVRIPLFAQLSPRQLQGVVDRLPERTFGGDQHIVRQGHSADTFYLLVEGEADVRYQSPEGEEPTVLTTLEPGGRFGDDAVIEEETYDGSLVTNRPSRFLVVSREALEELIENLPAVERAFEQEYLSSEPRSSTAWAFDRTGEGEAVPQSGIGSYLSPWIWRFLHRSGRVQSFDAGDEILEAGAIPEALFILLEGAVRPDPDSLINTPGTPLNLTAVVASRSQSGALQAAEASRLLIHPREDLRALVQKHPSLERALRSWHASSRN